MGVIVQTPKPFVWKIGIPEEKEQLRESKPLELRFLIIKAATSLL